MDKLATVIARTIENSERQILVGDEISASALEIRGNVRRICSKLLRDERETKVVLFSIDTEINSICFLVSALILGIPLIQVRDNIESKKFAINIARKIAPSNEIISVGTDFVDSEDDPPYKLNLENVVGDESLGDGINLVEIAQGHICYKDSKNSSALAIVQLTSGTTGSIRGITLTDSNIFSNLSAIGNRTGLDCSSDTLASWLPLHHDMGLMSLLLCLTWNVPLYLIKPRSFIRNPAKWITCLSSLKVTGVIMPSLGMKLIMRPIRRISDSDLDLSSLKYIMVGSDMTYSEQVRDFEQALAAYGLKFGTVKPAYGLAENVVGVTAHCFRDTPSTIRVPYDIGTIGEPIRILNNDVSNSAAIISNGTVLDGTEVLILANGRRLPDLHLGEIAIVGESVTGLIQESDGEHKRDYNNPLPTGDLGFILDDNLYVVGRKKNLIKVLGKSYYPEGIELALKTHFKIDGCIVAQCVDFKDAKDKLIVFIDRASSKALIGSMNDLEGKHPTILTLLNKVIMKDFGIKADLVTIIKVSFPRTSSGKIVRNELERLYRATPSSFETIQNG